MIPQEQNHGQSQRDTELVRAIFETAVDCIITIDERGVIESVNPAVERTFGYSDTELIGQNVKILMPSPDREQHDGYLAHYHRTGERKIIGIGREVVAQRKDGRTFPVYLAVSEMHVGGKRKYAGIIRDISERAAYEASLRRQAEELQRAKESLEVANRAKDHFMAVLSHELRTPLTPALAMLSLLEGDEQVRDDLREMLHSIRRNVELEARLIDDLLDLTRVTRGKVQLQTEHVDVHAAMLETLEICRPEIDARSLQVSAHLEARHSLVLADPARLKQILWNLVKNAVKFTPSGGHVAVKTRNEAALLERDEPESASVTNEVITIEVSDSGIGIEQHALPRIFNAFEQASHWVSRQFGGLGLGLAISRALVELHHGQITADSEGHGKGATFTVKLPTTRTLAAERPAGVPDTRHAPMRILLVDDHAETLRAIRMLLEHSGHEVETAASVQEGRAKLQREFDLLVSDIGLPDGSGHELMEYAAARGKITGIALSGYGMEEDIRRSREAGFAEHLVKPVNLATLRAAVARAASLKSGEPAK